MEDEELIYNKKVKNKASSYDKNFKSDELIYTPKQNKEIHKTTKAGANIHGFNQEIGDSKYDNGLTYTSDINPEDIQSSINEYRAQNQPWVAKASAGFARATTKALTEVLKLPGVVGGIIAIPFAEEGEGYDTALNNWWIKALDNVNETINTEALPVYVKKAVSEGNLWDNITSIDFWATDGADGLGYIIAMMAPGAAFEYAGLGGKMINGLASSKKLANLTTMAGKAEQATTVLKGLGLTGKNIDSILAVTGNTIFEAGAEAKGVGDDLDRRKPEFIKQQLDAGFTAEQAELSFKDQRALAMRNTFVSNVGVLLGPNAIMHKAIWGKAAEKFEKITEQGLKGVANRAGNSLKRVGTAFGSEGFWEEGSQTTIENMYVNKALRNELGKDNDFNIGEFTQEYINTLNTTDGQKAIFLGGALGGPMMSYQGRKQDVKNQTKTNSVLNNIEGHINSFNTIFDNDIYQKNEDGSFVYKKDEEGNDTTEREYDNHAVVEKARALNFTEFESQLFDVAVQTGNTEVVDKLKQKAIFNMVQSAVHNGEIGLKALEQKLNENAKFQDIVEADQNKDPKNSTKVFITEILDIAKYLQKENEKFQDFSKDVIQLDDVRSNDKLKENFLNRLNASYISTKQELRYNEKKLEELEKKRDNILEELNVNSALSTEDILNNGRLIGDYKVQSPLLTNVLDNIYSLTTNINNSKKDIAEIWKGNDLVNKSFSQFLDNWEADETKFKQKEKYDNIVLQINNAVELKDLDGIETDDSVLNDLLNRKKAILEIQKDKQTTETKNINSRAKNRKEVEKSDEFDYISDQYEKDDEIVLNQDNNYFGLPADKVRDKSFRVSKINQDKKTVTIKDESGKLNLTISFESLVKNLEHNPDDSYSTEGGLNQNNNQETEKITSSKDIVHDSVDVKVITINPTTDERYPWISEAAEEYERLPQNKEGKIVEFEINDLNKNSTTPDIEKRRQEELDENSGKSKILEKPTQDKQEVINKGEKILKENKDLVEEIEKEFTNEDEALFNELDEKLSNLLIKATRGAVSYTISNGKVVLTVSKVHKGNIINSNYTGSIEGQIGEFEIGDNVQVSNGSVAVPGKVTKVSPTGRISEAQSENGEIIIRNGIVLSSETIQRQREINAKYNAELIKTQKNNSSSNLKPEWNEALEMIKNKDFSNPEFLIKHLPLNVVFNNGGTASLETHNPNFQEKFDRTTRNLREAIVMELSKGTSIKAITTTIAGQNNGELQIEDEVLENSLLDLYEVSGDNKKINLENLYIVDDLGNLLNGKGQKWAANRKLSRGEVYMKIHTANGTPFPLKLNVQRVNNLQAEALYELYKYRFQDITTNTKATLLRSIPEDIQEIVKSNLSKEIELFKSNGKSYDDITIKDLTDLLIWDGTKSPKSQIRFYDGKLLVMNKEYTAEEFNEAKDDFIDALVSNKRQHIRFKDKKGGIKSLSIDNPNRLYLDYLLQNNILNTNAKVNQPTFKGNTSIYLTPDQVKVNGKLSEFNKQVKRNEFKSIIGNFENFRKKFSDLFKLRLKLTDDESNYIDRYNNEYDRVSTLKSYKGTKQMTKAESMRNTSKRGNVIDSVFRNFFNDTKYHNLDKFIEMFTENVDNINNNSPEENDIEFNNDSIVKLFSIMNSYAQLFKEKKWKVYSQEFTVGGKIGALGTNDGRYAGTIDMIVENEIGELFLIDLKTSTLDRTKFKYENTKGDAEDTFLYAYKDKIQLNTYAYLMEQAAPNTNIQGLYILPIQLTADEKTRNSKFTNADNISDFNEDLPLLEVEYEKGSYENVLGIDVKDLTVKKTARKSNKFDVSKTDVKGESFEGVELDRFELASFTDTLPTKSEPQKKETTSAEGKFSMSDILSKMDVDDIVDNFELDKNMFTHNYVELDGERYYFNAKGPKDSRFLFAKKTDKGYDFNIKLSVSELNKLKAKLVKISLDQTLLKNRLEKIWNSRLESVSLSKVTKKEAPASTDVVKKAPSVKKEQMKVNDIDFEKMSVKDAQAVFLKLSRAYNDKFKSTISALNGELRNTKDAKASLRKLISFLEENNIEREEIKTKCK